MKKHVLMCSACCLVLVCALVACSESSLSRGGGDAGAVDGFTFSDGIQQWPEAGRPDGAPLLPSEANFCGAQIRCWENPLPQGNTLNRLWIQKADDMVFFGDSGTILRYDGSEWSYESPKKGIDILSVWGDESGPLLATGRFGEVIQKKDKTWKRYAQGATQQNLVAIRARALDDVMFFGARGDVAGSGGKGWSLSHPLGEDVRVATAFHLGDVTYIGGSALWRYDGASWTVIEGIPVDEDVDFFVDAIWGTAEDDLYVLGAWRNTYHFDGTSWKKVPTEEEYPSGSPRALWGSSSKDLFAAGHNAVWRYQGDMWREMETPDHEAGYIGVNGTASDDVYAFGHCGRVHRFDGQRWSELSSGLDCSVRDITVDKEGNAFAVCDYANVLRRTKEGRWERMGLSSIPEEENFCTPPEPDEDPPPGPRDFCSSLSSIWGSPDNLFVAGERGVVLHYDGSTWRKMNTGLEDHYGAQISSLWGFASDDVYASGADGMILRYDGNTWSKQDTGVSADLWALWGTAPDDMWAAGRGGSGGSILHYDGSSWTDTKPEGVHASISAIWGSGPNDVWAVGRDTVLRYDGESWKEVPGVPRANDFFNGVWGTGKNDVFIVADWGLVLHYDGKRWASMFSGTNNILFTVAGRGKDIYVGGSCGTILHRR